MSNRKYQGRIRSNLTGNTDNFLYIGQIYPTYFADSAGTSGFDLLERPEERSHLRKRLHVFQRVILWPRLRYEVAWRDRRYSNPRAIEVGPSGCGRNSPETHPL